MQWPHPLFLPLFPPLFLALSSCFLRAVPQLDLDVDFPHDLQHRKKHPEHK